MMDRHRALADSAEIVLRAVDGARARIEALVLADRDARVRAELARLGLDRLGQLTDKNLRLRALADAGYLTVLDVLDATIEELDQVEGVGPQTARSALAAAQQLAEVIGAGTPFRIDLDPTARQARSAARDRRDGVAVAPRARRHADSRTHPRGTADPADHAAPDRSVDPGDHSTGGHPGPAPTPPSSAAVSAEVVALLHRLLRLDPAIEPHRTGLEDYVGSVRELLQLAAPAANRLLLAFRRPRVKAAAVAALGRLAAWDPWLSASDAPTVVERLEREVRRPAPPRDEVWTDVERRSARYYALLGEIVPMPDDALAAHGLLPSELAERVAACPLDQSLLRADLRGYQAFGARFALNQGRALLGDEMGLGKTVQAVAAMADCAARGDRHFLVVCPASVLINWVREVTAHSTLTPHRLHGPERDEAIARWLADGGVGVTTFDGLAHIPAPADEASAGDLGPHDAPDGVDHDAPEDPDRAPDGGRTGLGMLVVDEAHYVKNPRALRSRAVARWAAGTWRVLFMTGTPMENRLEEFLALVRMLQPEVTADVPRHLGLAGADTFRRQVAPVYLRRNQQDVLVELPELVEVEEWEELGGAAAAYRQAVAAGSFMAMRRAAFTPDPADSTKMQRLLEIVADAGENGHRVLVFSYFRDVLDAVVAAVTTAGIGPALGPITGSVPPEERQRLVDELAGSAPGTVLVAQVQAGGVGLNIQSASVVVLCEPQLKPTAESQAIARVHRMGQLRTVVVHRLLTEDAVDERILEILTEKRRLFDAYVRDSSLAEEALAAVDVSQAELARQVVTAEQARLGYGPAWDELDAPPGDDDQGRTGAAPPTDAAPRIGDTTPTDDAAPTDQPILTDQPT
ncbi:MAG: helicase, superfamily [Actinotalea sp.]|nr:helicase, superfamily [Actinotalea sp.]